MISDVGHTGAERHVKEMMRVILIWERRLGVVANVNRR